MWGKWALVVPPAACKLAAMKIHAHSLRDRDESLWELLSDHLARVGELAGEFARPFGGEEIARAEGLLHDIGKCAAAYQKYIRELGSSPDHARPGRSKRSSAMARSSAGSWRSRSPVIMRASPTGRGTTVPADRSKHG